MSVRELLRWKAGRVISVKTTARVAVATRLLMRHHIGGLPVLDGVNSVVGFVSEREVVAAVDQHEHDVRDLRVASIMRNPAPFCRSGDRLEAVMERMTRERLRHLVVKDGDRVAGVISVGDLEQLETEAGVLRDYLAGQRARR